MRGLPIVSAKLAAVTLVRTPITRLRVGGPHILLEIAAEECQI